MFGGFGGVIILVRKCLIVEELKVQNTQPATDCHCQVVWIGIQSRDMKLAIGGVYIPPSNRKRPVRVIRAEFDALEAHQEKLSSDGWSILVLGDLNAHLRGERVGGEGAYPNVAGSCLREWVNQQSLHIFNNTARCYGKWTRIEGGKKSVPDYVIGCDGIMQWLSKMEIDDTQQLSSNSDHNWMVCDVSITPMISQHKQPKQVWNIRGDTDWTLFRQRVQSKSREWLEKDWDGQYSISKGEQMTLAFNQILLECGREVVGQRWVGQGGVSPGKVDEVAEGKIKIRKRACRAFNRAKKLKAAKKLTQENVDRRKAVYDWAKEDVRRY